MRMRLRMCMCQRVHYQTDCILTNRTTDNFVVAQFHTDSLSVAKVDVRPRLAGVINPKEFGWYSMSIFLEAKAF
jgi:hypothetical protein